MPKAPAWFPTFTCPICRREWFLAVDDLHALTARGDSMIRPFACCGEPFELVRESAPPWGKTPVNAGGDAEAL